MRSKILKHEQKKLDATKVVCYEKNSKNGIMQSATTVAYDGSFEGSKDAAPSELNYFAEMERKRKL